MSERCAVTELLVEQCACARHRGGDVEAPETVGAPFAAAYAGFCSTCEHPIEPGEMIARLADEPDYVHAGRCPR